MDLPLDRNACLGKVIQKTKLPKQLVSLHHVVKQKSKGWYNLVPVLSITGVDTIWLKIPDSFKDSSSQF